MGLKNNYLITFVIGTRPEAIKMAPLILEFRKSERFKINIILSGQHDEMIRPIMNFFNLKEDANFNVLGQCNSLEQTTSLILNELSNYFDKNIPDGNPRKLLDSKLINKLGWKPTTTLEIGLKNTYDWFLENFNSLKK